MTTPAQYYNYAWLSTYEGVTLYMSNGSVLENPIMVPFSTTDPLAFKWDTRWNATGILDEVVECYLSGVLAPPEQADGVTVFWFKPGTNYLSPCGEHNGVIVTCGPTQAECKDKV